MKLKRISFGEYTINIDGVKLMDLNDEFTNACLVPRENQINIINKLLSRVAGISGYNELYENNLILHLYIIKLLSEYPGKSNMLIISNELFNNEIAEYIEIFGKENIINLISNDELNYDMHYFDVINDYIKNMVENHEQYRIVIADFRNISQNDKHVFNEKIKLYLEKLTEVEGYIITGDKICYKPRKEPIEEYDYFKELLDKISSNIVNNKVKASNYIVEELIKEIADFEKYILKNRDKRKLYEFAYPINELKNSVINYYISNGEQNQVVEDVKVSVDGMRELLSI